jgi:hypothetical protein
MIALIFSRLDSYRELPYVIVEFLSHIIILVILAIGYFRPLKNILEIKANSLGKGVYSKISFKEGNIILKFRGKLHTLSEVVDKLGGPDDHYLQIAKNRFLGPSGGADDYVNHSCNPNAGLFFKNNSVYLICILPINPGTEITFDYSTCVLDEGNIMECSCKEHNCRGSIAGFTALDENLRKKYIDLGIVAPFIHVEPFENKKKYQSHILLGDLKNNLLETTLRKGYKTIRH